MYSFLWLLCHFQESVFSITRSIHILHLQNKVIYRDSPSMSPALQATVSQTRTPWHARRMAGPRPPAASVSDPPWYPVHLGIFWNQTCQCGKLNVSTLKVNGPCLLGFKTKAYFISCSMCLQSFKWLKTNRPLIYCHEWQWAISHGYCEIMLSETEINIMHDVCSLKKLWKCVKI